MRKDSEILKTVKQKVNKTVFKHLRGQHNQALHGNRGASVRDQLIDYRKEQTNPKQTIEEVLAENKKLKAEIEKLTRKIDYLEDDLQDTRRVLAQEAPKYRTALGFPKKGKI